MTWRDEGIGLYCIQIEFIYFYVIGIDSFFFFRFYKVFNGILIFLEFGILEIVEIEAITWAKISLVDWGIYYTAD